MNKTRLLGPALWLALFVGAWLVALVVRAPAAVMVNGAGAPLRGLLMQPSGTLWSGQAVLRPPLPPLTLSWRASPGALWRGCLSARLRFAHGSAETGSARVQGCPFTDSAVVEALSLQTAAADWLPALGLELLRIDGTVDVQLASLTVSPDGFRGTGEARWRDASLAIGRRVRLGTVTAALTGTGGPLSVEVRNAQADLGLDVALEIDPGGRYRLTGDLDPRGDADLQATLATAGDLRPDGRVSVRAAGQLR